HLYGNKLAGTPENFRDVFNALGTAGLKKDELQLMYQPELLTYSGKGIGSDGRFTLAVPAAGAAIGLAAAGGGACVPNLVACGRLVVGALDAIATEATGGHSLLVSTAWGSAVVAKKFDELMKSAESASEQVSIVLQRVFPSKTIPEGEKLVEKPLSGLLNGLDDLLPNTNTRVLTEKEARALTGEDKGLIYVLEGPKGKQNAQDFQAGTAGAFSDVESGKLGVPALRYTNPNEKGVNFVKFDGLEKGPNGDSILLIDAKTKLAIWNESTQSSVLDTMRRVKSALQQNPGYKVVYEFPSAKAEAQARKFIRDSGYNDFVSTRVRGQ
ncbi:hypothetical protein, partial [Xanthomonas melonis]|uniref:hypothetical protein n=1 Tax=Xanthomonas melonis TaxID=56456 RepID=UPI003EB71864